MLNRKLKSGLPGILFALTVILITEVACHKSSSTPIITPVSLNIVNVIPSTAVNGILPIFGSMDSPYYYIDIAQLPYPYNFLYTPPAGVSSISVVNGWDTATTQLKAKLYSGNFNLKSNGIYSFFLGGDTTSVDTLLVQDNLPYYPYTGDSVAGLRIVNMSTGSQPYTISIAGNPYTQPEFSNIAYKGVTNFKSYSVTSAVSNMNGGAYNFTLWDNMGDSLTTFSWSYTVFLSNTIVISGSPSPTAIYPINFLQMNNY